MTFSRKLLLVSGLLVAAGALIEHKVLAPQRAELARLQREADSVAAAQRRHRHELASLQRQLAELDRAAADARFSAAAAEASSAMKLWANRIALLKRLLGEMPTQWIPELRLLGATDWVHVVRARELDTPENIRTSLGAARAIARQRMAELLQQAARAFAEQSGGMLPRSIGELASHLRAPGDSEMLQRYILARSGRLDASDEPIFREVDTSDFIVVISRDSHYFDNNEKWQKLSGENDANYVARALVGLESSLSAVDSHADKAVLAQLKTYQVLMESFGPMMESFFGSSAGPFMKQASARFAAEHGKPPENMGDLARYFDEIPQFMTEAQPIAAEMEYMFEHDGQKPTTPEQLAPYLAKPLHELRLLRNMRITVEGEKLSMKISFSSKPSN